MRRITVVGLGPGNQADMTAAAVEAISRADAIVGYKPYMRFVEPFRKSSSMIIDTGMRAEVERAAKAVELAASGLDVVVVSSGDACIYGMAPLIYELADRSGSSDIEITTVPGISAFQKASSLLGAPMGHDFCVISLSDLLTSWSLIERRIRAAAAADFVTAVYNPRSHGRYWQLDRLREIFLQEGRSPSTPVGYVRQAGRPDQQIKVTTLGRLDTDDIDMLTIVIIGNSLTRFGLGERMITPRGYFRDDSADDGRNPGQAIMNESFATIRRELQAAGHDVIDTDALWPLLHAIHTTADFDMTRLLRVDSGAVRTIYESLLSAPDKTIVTDVSMAAAGIRKGALERLGLSVVCYINDPRATAMARDKGITRSQAAMRLAAEEHPSALYAIGNAPTALIELCDLVRHGKARPCGIVAAPVGFVHVEESKHMAKTLRDIPKLIVDGRKGGSNLAATLVNSILCYPDSATINPGRDV